MSELIAVAEASAARPAPPTMEPSVPPLLAALRAGTRAAHDRIESLPPMNRLLAPDLAEADYVAALSALHAFHAFLAPPLAAHMRAMRTPLGEAGQDRLAALARDLAWFGAVPRPPGGVQLSIPDQAAALGALYVLEGSALGGRVIGRALAQSLGVRAGAGGCFFCATSAEQARQRWRDVSNLFAAQGAVLSQAGHASAVATANASFAALEIFMRAGATTLRRRTQTKRQRAIPHAAHAGAQLATGTMN